MRIFKGIFGFSLILIFLVLPSTYSYSKTAPSSFADLAEKLKEDVSLNQKVKEQQNIIEVSEKKNETFAKSL